MATPALRALHQSPEISGITLIGTAGPVAILEGLPYATDSIVFKARAGETNVLSRRGVAWELRRRKVDAAVLLPNSLSSAMMAWLGGVPIRVGFAKNGRKPLLTHPASLRDKPAPSRLALLDEYEAPIWKHAPAIDYYLHIVSQLGIDSSDKRMELNVSPDDREQALGLLSHIGFSSSPPLIVINNASGTSPSRLWPKEHVVQIACMLARSGIQVVFHSGPKDRAASIDYSKSAAHPLVRSMGEVDDLPLGLSRGLLDLATAVVTTDSGPRHIAVALNKPVVSLFGPTSVGLTQTYNHPETTEQVVMSCRPCRKDDCPLGHQNCMRDISPDTVFQSVQKILRTSCTVAA